MKSYRCVICGKVIDRERAGNALSRGMEPKYDSATCLNTANVRRYREKKRKGH